MADSITNKVAGLYIASNALIDIIDILFLHTVRFIELIPLVCCAMPRTIQIPCSACSLPLQWNNGPKPTKHLDSRRMYLRTYHAGASLVVLWWRTEGMISNS